MLANHHIKRLAYAGLLFDLAGSYPVAAYAGIQERRKHRPKNVDAAMRSDVAAIARDMRRALDKWGAVHG